MESLRAAGISSLLIFAYSSDLSRNKLVGSLRVFGESAENDGSGNEDLLSGGRDTSPIPRLNLLEPASLPT
eukprot:9309702-Pyramimonas_sp.AAC.1